MNDDPNDVEQDGPHLSDELQHFASDLARLIPRDDRLARERLSFLAGQASVTRAPNRTAKVFGLSLESRAWPAAFAGMTAVAAVLLFALIVQPERSGIGPSPNDDRVYDVPQLAIESDNHRDVLSTLDAYRRDVDVGLAKHERKPAEGDARSARAFGPSAPALTPNAWHQVINEAESAQPSPHDASGLIQHQGANS
jgi:hypothetical protein